MEKYINRNAFYKELMSKHGKEWTYKKVCDAFNGKPGSLTTSEKTQMSQLLDGEIKKLKENIKKS